MLNRVKKQFISDFHFDKQGMDYLFEDVQLDKERADLKLSETEVKELYFEDSQILEDRINTALKNGRHLILIGPPGTGKSKLAKIICEHCWGKSQYIMATATSDWSTYDTIGSYRLTGLKKDELEFVPGIFLNSISRNVWLIIDEINRADIDKAFGALFTALSKDKTELPFKENKKTVRIITQESEIDENFSDYPISKNWRIIATMNTFDKSSLYEMSYAFMRRFAFIPVDVPINISLDLLQKYVLCWNIELKSDDIVEKIVNLWTEINKYRVIGPAIVEDMLRHINNASKAPYSSAIIMNVLPQFEGLKEDDQIQFINSLFQKNYLMDEDADNGRLGIKQFAVEFFGINPEKLYLDGNEKEQG